MQFSKYLLSVLIGSLCIAGCDEDIPRDIDADRNDDHTDIVEYVERTKELEDRVSQLQTQLQQEVESKASWQVVTAVTAAGGLILLFVGIAMGSKAREDSKVASKKNSYE